MTAYLRPAVRRKFDERAAQEWEKITIYQESDRYNCQVDAVPTLYWHIGYPTTIQLQDESLFTVDHQWTQTEPYVQYVVGMRWAIDG